jgi:membrane protein DedA with SNARE-associated domain
MITGLFSGIIDFYMTHIGYGMVVLLMTVESSFIPFPSEIVIPPAAWKAAQGELSLAGVVAAGIAGSILGALINYGLARYLGRALLYRLADTRAAHFLLVDRHSLEKAEAYFLKYGKSSTFIGRLIPAIRQLISLPAGLAGMRMRDFLLYTVLGSGIWTVILALLGYHLYSRKEVLEMYYAELSWAFIALGVLFAAYLLWKGLRKEKREEG